MSERDCDWWDDTWNVVGGCWPITKACLNCFATRWNKSHPHEAETVHTGVIAIDENGQPRWNGKLTVLPDGHPSWNFPSEYAGAKHPKLGPGKPSLILVAGLSDLFIAGRSTKVIDRVVETIALSPHIGLFLSKYTGPRYRGQMANYFLNQSPLTLECSQNIWLGFSAEGQIEFNIRWTDMRPLAEAGWFIYVFLRRCLDR